MRFHLENDILSIHRGLQIANFDIFGVYSSTKQKNDVQQASVKNYGVFATVNEQYRTMIASNSRQV